MPIIIKEIRVKTVVEKMPHETILSKETISFLKRSILRELADTGGIKNRKTRKDR